MENEPIGDIETSYDMEGESRLKKSETIRSEIEQKKLLDKVAFIARVLGRRSDLLVVPGDGWKASLSEKVQEILNRGAALDEIDPALLEPKVLTYPKQDLVEKGDDYVLGVTRHEIGHFLFSDYRELLKFQKKAKDEGKNPGDAATLANAIEDPRVNNLLAGESHRARERLETIYHEDMPNILSRFGKMSPPMQFCFLAIASWTGEFLDEETLEQAMSQATSQEAQDAFREARPKIQEAMQERKGRRAMGTLSSEIWPIYARLVENYLENPQKAEGERAGEGEEGSEIGGRSWSELSEEEKEAARQATREQLDRENEEFNEQFGPKTMQAAKDEGGITHYVPKPVNPEEIQDFQEEIEKRKKELAEKEKTERARQREEAEKLRQQAAGLTERRTGLTEGERSQYNQFVSEMRPYINQLTKKLDEIFPKKEDFVFERGRSHGTRITPRRLAQEVPTGRGLFFEKKEIQEKPEVICSVLMDVSGSMHWQGAIELAVKEMIMLLESLQTKEIDFELIAFSDTPEVIKPFGEAVSGQTCKKIIGLLESGGGGTALGQSVDFAAKRIEAEMRREHLPGFVVVHTDGEPGDDLDSVLERWRVKMPIVGIGVGNELNGQSIKEHFGESGRYTANQVDAPREILDVLRQQFSRYQKKY